MSRDRSDGASMGFRSQEEFEAWRKANTPTCKSCDQLKAENDRLFKCLYSANTQLELLNRDSLRKQLDEARELLIKICSHHLDGNIRATVRDCVNGLPCVQDIYGYCDNIDADIYAWLEANKK